MKLLFIDLETTGTDPEKHGIHQLAGKIIINGVVKEEFNFKCRHHPSAYVVTKALEVSNVTYEDLMGYPEMPIIFKLFDEMISKYVDGTKPNDKFFIVGYNTQAFDFAHLNKWYFRNSSRKFFNTFWTTTLDVMILAAAHLAPRRHLMINFQQRTVAQFLDIEVDEEKLHDAGYDINICHKIYDIVYSKY